LRGEASGQAGGEGEECENGGRKKGGAGGGKKAVTFPIPQTNLWGDRGSPQTDWVPEQKHPKKPKKRGQPMRRNTAVVGTRVG